MPIEKKTKSETEVRALKRRLVELKKQMNRLGPLMRGSLVVIGTRNKQPYFSVNMNRKTHLVYLGKRREGKAREYSENYHRLQQIVDEMTRKRCRSSPTASRWSVLTAENAFIPPIRPWGYRDVRRRPLGCRRYAH